jgi:glycosyltransferase involved in cell wall biosynthesis
MAERFIGDFTSNSLYFFRKVGSNEWLRKVDSLFTDRLPIGNNLYLNALTTFYKEKAMLLNVSLMHAHFGMVGYKLSKLKKELSIPLVTTFYGNDVSYCLKSKRWINRYSDMFRVGDRFIVLCDEAKNRLINSGCPEDKIRLWNIGLDLENYPYRERNNIKPIKFLTVARFVETKGYPVLLKAFSGLLRDYKDITLTLVGLGPLKRQILYLIYKLRIQENVSVIDTTGRSDFYSLFRDILYKHDIFVLPSTTSKDGEDEGGPALTMIYAQSTGLPVISTPFPGAEISVIDGETGLLCEQDNPDLLRIKMEYLVNNNRLKNKMGLNSSMLVKEKFSLAPQLGKLHNIYNELL